jgi:hypothetical protein
MSLKLSDTRYQRPAHGRVSAAALALLACAVAVVQLGCHRPCTLGVERAPELRGFRLRMSVEDVQKRFPGFTAPAADEFGLAKVTVRTGSSASGLSRMSGAGVVLLDPARFPELAETDSVKLDIVDGRVASIAVFYGGGIRWRSSDEFRSKVSEPLNLNGSWESTSWSRTVKSMSCGGLLVYAGYKDNDQGDERPYVEMVDTVTAVEPQMREYTRRKQNENRQKAEEEERRKEFRP